MKFDFMGKRKLWLLLALGVITIGLISLVVQGLNFGIDFTGGTRLVLNLPGGFSTSEVRDVLRTVEATDASGRKVTLENSYIQRVTSGDGNEAVIRTVPLTETELDTLLAAIEQKWTDFSSEDIRDVGNVGPTVGGELLRNALLALFLASVAMIAYVSFRFQFKFAVAALSALLFDAFVMISAFSIFQIELSSLFVASILTIVGYSINATIVIFDRLRENLKYNSSEKMLAQTIDGSINQSLVRCINTAITTLLTIGALLFLGGETLRPFTLPMFIGIISGTFSSIFLATSLWYTMKLRERRVRA